MNHFLSEVLPPVAHNKAVACMHQIWKKVVITFWDKIRAYLQSGLYSACIQPTSVISYACISLFMPISRNYGHIFTALFLGPTPNFGTYRVVGPIVGPIVSVRPSICLSSITCTGPNVQKQHFILI